MRKVEELVRLYNETESFEKKRPTASKEKPAEYQELKSRLTRLFDTRVKLVSDDKGKERSSYPLKMMMNCPASWVCWII